MSFISHIQEAKEGWIIVDKKNVVKVTVIGPNKKHKQLTDVKMGKDVLSVKSEEIYSDYKAAKEAINEARIKKPGNPNAKCSYDTKKDKEEKAKNKHKGKNMQNMQNMQHEGVAILDETINAKTLKSLETLAGLKEDEIQIFDNGFKFTFERSQVANRCKIIRYHDKVILEFRKVTDNLIQGQMDQLVFESVIDPREFSEVFERVTGIYLSYI